MEKSAKKYKQTEIGEIPENWEVRKIDDLFDVFAGGDLAKINYLKTKIGDFKFPIYSNSLKNRGLYGYSDKYQYEPNCVTISARGDVGRAEYRTEPFNAIVRLLVLKPKTEISCKFAANYINGMIDFQHVGSAVNQLTSPMISSRNIAYPPINEQQKIDSILSSLDDKIELNQKMNKNLEEIGKALFKHWFVDFEFPFDFAQGKPSFSGKPYKSSGGKMEGSELGLIPEGWEVGKLRNKIDLQGGLSYKGNFLTENIKESIPMISMGCASFDSRFNYSGLKYYSGNFSSKYIVKQGDIVIPTRDVTQERKILGCPIIVPDNLGKKMIFATNLYLLNNKSNIPNEYIYQLFRTDRFRERMIGAAKGTTVLMLTKDSVLGFENVFPENRILLKYSMIMESFVLKVKINTNELINLSKVRDSLIPRLISGRIRVK